MARPTDPKKIEMGLRIAKAREAAGLTQTDLAERIGVSFQAVSRWELGITTPRDKSAYKLIADATKTSVPHILYGVEPTENGASLRHSDEVGQIVPSVAPKNVARFLTGDNTVVDGYTRTHFPCGGRSFRTLVTDTANAPELQIGDIIIIDPDLEPTPDDFVAVLYKGEPTVRVFGEDGEQYELVPLNTRHATIRTGNLHDILIGTITETGRQRRKPSRAAERPSRPD